MRCLLLFDALAQDRGRSATTRRGEVGRRPQDATPVVFLDVGPILAQQRLETPFKLFTLPSGDREFRVPEGYPIRASGWRIDKMVLSTLGPSPRWAWPKPAMATSEPDCDARAAAATSSARSSKRYAWSP